MTRGVADTAARLGTTPYAVLASAFATWLAGLCGTPGDVVLAASSANRTGRERSDVVGLLGDAVLLRARTSEARTFADLVTWLGKTLFTALDHQDLALTDVIELVSPRPGTSFFPPCCSPWSPLRHPPSTCGRCRSRCEAYPYPV